MQPQPPKETLFPTKTAWTHVLEREIFSKYSSYVVLVLTSSAVGFEFISNSRSLWFRPVQIDRWAAGGRRHSTSDSVMTAQKKRSPNLFSFQLPWIRTRRKVCDVVYSSAGTAVLVCTSIKEAAPSCTQPEPLRSYIRYATYLRHPDQRQRPWDWRN